MCSQRQWEKIIADIFHCYPSKMEYVNAMFAVQKRKTRTRRFHFLLFNPTAEDMQCLTKLNEQIRAERIMVRFLLWQLEVVEEDLTGRIRGYIEFHNAQTPVGVRATLGNQAYEVTGTLFSAVFEITRVLEEKALLKGPYAAGLPTSAHRTVELLMRINSVRYSLSVFIYQLTTVLLHWICPGISAEGDVRRALTYSDENKDH